MRGLSILDLPGPDFLNVFGLVVIVVLAATFFALRFADHTGRRAPPALPQEPDAMEIAYLNGGVNQVIRTLVYDLVQRGFVELARSEEVAPTHTRPQPGDLNPMEQCVYEMTLSRPRAHELFDDSPQRDALNGLLAPARERLAAADLLQPASVKLWKRWMQMIGASVILGVSGAKLYVAWTAGPSNVSYLVFLTLAALAALYSLTYVMTSGVASRRGLAFLDEMRTAYAARLSEAVSHIGSPGPEARAFHGASLFLIGLFGFSVLRRTTERKFYDSFRRASATDGSS